MDICFQNLKVDPYSSTYQTSQNKLYSHCKYIQTKLITTHYIDKQTEIYTTKVTIQLYGINEECVL